MNTEIIQLMGSLIAMGIDSSKVAIAGGCLRDKMLGPPGVEPKDTDVVIVGGYKFDERLLPTGWCVTAMFDSEYGGEVKSEDFDKRIDYVVKLRYQFAGLVRDSPITDLAEVDLIFANGHYATTGQFVRHFDFNLNQWMLPLIPALYGSKPQFVGDNRGKLVETRGTEVHPDRRARMIRMAHQYGWDISEFQGELL